MMILYPTEYEVLPAGGWARIVPVEIISWFGEHRKSALRRHEIVLPGPGCKFYPKEGIFTSTASPPAGISRNPAAGSEFGEPAHHDHAVGC